jgi:hypothetical protein
MKTKIIVISCLLLLGCSTYKVAKETKIDNEKTFEMSYESIWPKIISYVSSNGMNVKTIDKASGLITFEKAYAPASLKYLDCGSMVSPNSKTESGLDTDKISGGTVSMNFFVEKISEKSTRVRINIFGKIIFAGVATLYGYIPGREERCYSTGVFEKEVFEVIGK